MKLELGLSTAEGRENAIAGKMSHHLLPYLSSCTSKKNSMHVSFLVLSPYFGCNLPRKAVFINTRTRAKEMVVAILVYTAVPTVDRCSFLVS